MNRDLHSGMCKSWGILLRITMTYSVRSNLMADTFIANASPEEYEILCVLHIHALIVISQPSLHLSQFTRDWSTGYCSGILKRSALQAAPNQ